jgi:hypothetical protein
MNLMCVKNPSSSARCSSHMKHENISISQRVISFTFEPKDAMKIDLRLNKFKITQISHELVSSFCSIVLYTSRLEVLLHRGNNYLY